MGRLREWRLEWSARRAGRRFVSSNLGRATRAMGGMGICHKGLHRIEKGGDTYAESFDRRLPPSIFVSERDRQRANRPIPVAERCLEDWSEPSDQ